MIRPHDDTSIAAGGLLSRVKRRQLLRIGFLTAMLLAVGELSAAFLPFFRVITSSSRSPMRVTWWVSWILPTSVAGMITAP